jgi:hypothetical protein
LVLKGINCSVKPGEKVVLFFWKSKHMHTHLFYIQKWAQHTLMQTFWFFFLLIYMETWVIVLWSKTKNKNIDIKNDLYVCYLSVIPGETDSKWCQLNVS